MACYSVLSLGALFVCNGFACREYPNYRFHFMKYPRREYLDLALKHQGHAQHRDTDFVEEMLYSLANLHAAAEAHAFVGTLSSNWCMMVSC